MSNDRDTNRADDNAYYSRRAAEETGRSRKAGTLPAQQAHADLAAIFRRKAGETKDLP